jgi:hypothetical protein
MQYLFRTHPTHFGHFCYLTYIIRFHFFAIQNNRTSLGQPMQTLYIPV